MRKNLRTSTRGMNSRRAFLLARHEEKKSLTNDPPYPTLVQEVIEITKLLTQAKVLEGGQIPTYTSFDQKEISQSAFFKLEPLGKNDLFLITASPLGIRLIEALHTDLRPVTSHFEQHLFHPYFLAFINAKKRMEITYKSDYLFFALQAALREGLPRSAAQNVIDLCYVFISHIQHADQHVGLTTAVNNFDRCVRQNASSLKVYLQKLLKKHKNLTIAKVNLTLRTYDNFKLDHRDPDSRAETMKNSYRALGTARTEYIKNLKQHPVIGEMVVGYIWKLRYNPSTTWAYEVIFLVDTKQSFVYTASEIQDFCEVFWLRRDFDSYLIKHPTKDGCDQRKTALPDALTVHDKDHVRKIQNLITDLIRTDYLVQVAVPDNGRAFGKGVISKKSGRAKSKK